MDEPWTGKIRPRQIPEHWSGRATRGADGWCWQDPDEPGNSVRFYRGDPDSPLAHKRAPYVIVCAGGRLLDRNGKPIADSGCPDD